MCSRTVLARCPLQCLVHPVTIHLPQPRDLQPFGGPVVAFCNRSFHSFSAECSPITLEPFEDPVVAADGRIYGEHLGAGCLVLRARGHSLALPSRQGRRVIYWLFRNGYRPCCVQPIQPVWLYPSLPTLAERRAIEDWLYREGNNTSPLTGMPLQHKMLMPCDAMRHCVAEVGCRMRLHGPACVAVPIY